MLKEFRQWTIPENWTWVELNRICLPVEKTNGKSKNPNKEFLYLDINSIDNKINQIVEPKTYKWANAPSRAQQIVKSGDILFSTVRTYLKNIARVGDEFENQIASTGFCVIRPFYEINSKFIFYYALTNQFIDPLSAIQRGSSYPAVRNGDVLAQKIPLPPLAEQHRIVARIEELFSDLDAGIASLKQAQAQLKTYRQAVLKYAFEGKLTGAWREQHKPEPAEKLLAQIKAERERQYQQQLAEWQKAGVDNKGKKKPPKPQKPKEFPPLTETELAALPELPEGWRWVRIGEISRVATGVTPLKKKKEYYENGRIAWITSSALNNDFVTKASFFVTRLALDETNLKLFPKNTLLVALYGEGKTRGKCSELLIEATTNQAIAAITQIGLEEQVRPFLKWFLKKNYDEIRKKSSGGVQPNLTLGIVEATVFPFCSLNEQHQIVQEIESRITVCDKLEESIKESLQKAEALRQSILKKAFAGKLVPQDPNDEPAEKLLERIRAEKNKTQTP